MPYYDNIRQMDAHKNILLHILSYL